MFYKKNVFIVFVYAAIFFNAFLNNAFSQDVDFTKSSTFKQKNDQNKSLHSQNLQEIEESNGGSGFNIKSIISSSYSDTDDIQKSLTNLQLAKMVNIATKIDLLPKLFVEASKSKTTSISSSSDAFFLAARNISSTKYGVESSLSDLFYGYWKKSGAGSANQKASYYANIKNKNNFTIAVLESYKNIILNYLNYSSAVIQKDIAQKILAKTTVKREVGLESDIDLLRARIDLKNAENEIEYSKSLILKNIDDYNLKTKDKVSFNDINLDEIENLDVSYIQSLIGLVQIDSESSLESIVRENSIELLELKNKNKSLKNNAGYSFSTLLPNVKIVLQNQETKYDSLIIKQTNILGTLSFKLFDNTNLTSYIRARYDQKLNQFELQIKEREIIDNAKLHYINMIYSLNKLNNFTEEYKLERTILDLKKTQFDLGEININQILDQQKKLHSIKKDMIESKINYIIYSISLKNMVN